MTVGGTRINHFVDLDLLVAWVPASGKEAAEVRDAAACPETEAPQVPLSRKHMGLTFQKYHLNPLESIGIHLGIFESMESLLNTCKLSRCFQV